jgi:hypothetical protein
MPGREAQDLSNELCVERRGMRDWVKRTDCDIFPFPDLTLGDIARVVRGLLTWPASFATVRVGNWFGPIPDAGWCALATRITRDSVV